jgi:hypothetical protein
MRVVVFARNSGVESLLAVKSLPCTIGSFGSKTNGTIFRPE